MDNIYNPKWKALLIGGSSGVGKTVVASELAKHLSVSLLLLDDIRIAIQQVTTKETNPELHVFLNYSAEQWRKSESIYADWITVGKAMAKPLNAIIDHHVSILVLQRKVGLQSGQTNKFRLTMGAISLMVALLVIANAV
jgi:cytidylate kinase